MAATRRRSVDAVLVGMGWTGSIMARELTRAGLEVVGLERGRDFSPAEDFALPSVRDELRYFSRMELIQDPSPDTLTFRNRLDERALPIRKWGSFLPGEGVGGAGNHWGGNLWRYLPSDHRLRSHLTERYGASAIPQDMTIEDWPVSYDQLETHYDHFERLCGASGKAGNLRGRKVAGGNVFEGARRSEYPNPPLVQSRSAQLFDAASRALGYHPFPQPSANASQAYVNSEGLPLGACQYCGFCDRIGCESNAKAGPQTTLLPKLRQETRFTLRSQCWVTRILYDKEAKRATGVVYTDLRTGEEIEQPAEMVVLSAYVFGNVGLLLNSGIGTPYDPSTGKGSVGRNYCYQLSRVGVSMFFEKEQFNPFMGTPGSITNIDDLDADNFDHAGLGFVGGARIGCGHAGGAPIGYHPVPPGTPKWGTQFKQAASKWYQGAALIMLSGSNYANRYNYLDLDPTYKDRLGRPLVRMTYNFVENDYKMMEYCMERALKIARAMNPTMIGDASIRRGDYSIVPYQSTHCTGGTIMGSDPKTSVVNRYLQSWDAHNLFVLGTSTFPQQVAYAPTGPAGALTYHAASAIVAGYLKNPSALVQA